MSLTIQGVAIERGDFQISVLMNRVEYKKKKITGYQ
jgi:hypothetical protein